MASPPAARHADSPRIAGPLPSIGSRPVPRESHAWTQPLIAAAPLVVIVVAACALAVVLYLQFLPQARARLNVPFHDRNPHYLLGVNLALHAKEGDLVGMLRDLNRARIWPPLHGVLLAGVLLVGGVDYRLGVLPSLIAWAASIVLMFLVARRTLPRLGYIAGVLAAICFVASPAHRAYATDIMLESLGACLTLLVLYFYLRARQTGSLWAWRGLGLALTALFFEKYNYWGLALAAVLFAEVSAHRRVLWARFVRVIRNEDWRALLLQQSRTPLNCIFLVLVCLAVTIAVTGGTTFDLAGVSVSATSATNVVYAGYLVLIIRILLWWRKRGREVAGHLPAAWRTTLAWHVLPVALWFLWPNRLANFLWVMGPNNVERARVWSLAGSLAANARAFALEYAPDVGIAILLLALAVLAVVLVRRLQPGSVAVVALVVLSAAATLLHPNQKARFLHTWLPALWVLSAGGVSVVLSLCRFARQTWIPRAAGGMLVVIVAAWLLPTSLSPGHAEDQKPFGEQASYLDLSDHYLSEIAGAERPAFFANVPMQQFFEWTYLEAHQHHRPYEVEIKGLGADAEANVRRFEDWVHSTPCDVIVFVDRPLGPALHLLRDAIPYEQFRTWLPAQHGFQLASRRKFPCHQATVSIWRRVGR